MEGDLREPLTVDQTQKLVDQAIELHDRQLARYQRDSSNNAIKAAYIAAISTIIVGLLSWFISIDSNKDIKTDIEIIKNKIDKLEANGTLLKKSNFPKKTDSTHKK
jgi:hypothetical protein